MLSGRPPEPRQRELLPRVPRPGYPAFVYSHPNGRLYAGTYTNPGGDDVPSEVFDWTRSGTLLRSWTVPGQDLAGDQGAQAALSDAAGRLIVLEKSTSRVMRLDLGTGRFTTYARIPDLPTCAPGAWPDGSCSPNLVDGPAIPNYAAWGRGGVSTSPTTARPWSGGCRPAVATAARGSPTAGWTARSSAPPGSS